MVKYNVKYNNSRKKEAVSLRDMPSGFPNLYEQILALTKAFVDEGTIQMGVYYCTYLGLVCI